MIPILEYLGNSFNGMKNEWPTKFGNTLTDQPECELDRHRYMYERHCAHSWQAELYRESYLHIDSEKRVTEVLCHLYKTNILEGSWAVNIGNIS